MSDTHRQFPVRFSGKQIKFKAAAPIVARAVEQLVSGRDDGAIAEMFNSIDTAEHNYATTDYVFHCVEELIKKAIENAETDKSAETLKSLLNTFVANARWYYKLRIRNDIKNKPLGDVLAELERASEEMRSHLTFYFLEAVELVRTEVEATIERQRKRARIKQELKSLDPPEASTEDYDQAPLRFDEKIAKTKRHPDLTIDRAILLIDAIGGSRLKSADRNKLAEVLAFLTGYSMESVRQRYSALDPESVNFKGGTGSDSLRSDLKVLGHFFAQIGLRGEIERLSEKFGVPSTK